MSEIKFSVSLTFRIDWSELDMFGHVNNVMFMKYVQSGRVNYWETTNIHKHFTDFKIGPMLAATSCQFKKPLFYPGNATIKTGVAFMKNTSFGLFHHILNQQGELVATAEDVIVMFDYNTNEKIQIPEDIRGIIEKTEGRKF
jgi:acyl-CoA thioester hydrolase